MNRIHLSLLPLLLLFVFPPSLMGEPSQRAEAKVIVTFETKDYVIRVDTLLTRSGYRYSSWKKKSKQQKDAPDIEIVDGYYDNEQGCYLFIVGDVVEGEYNYKVYAHHRNGFNGIIVTRNQDVILKQAERKRL